MNKAKTNLTNLNSSRVINNHEQQFIGPVTGRIYRARISKNMLIHNEDLEAIRNEHGPVGDMDRLPVIK